MSAESHKATETRSVVPSTAGKREGIPIGIAAIIAAAALLMILCIGASIIVSDSPDAGASHESPARESDYEFGLPTGGGVDGWPGRSDANPGINALQEQVDRTIEWSKTPEAQRPIPRSSQREKERGWIYDEHGNRRSTGYSYDGNDVADQIEYFTD
jgi:hypothetical protein